MPSANARTATGATGALRGPRAGPSSFSFFEGLRGGSLKGSRKRAPRRGSPGRAPLRAPSPGVWARLSLPNIFLYIRF